MATVLKAKIDPDRIDVPSHIPADLVYPFDVYRDPAMRVDPFLRVSELQQLPPVVWNPISARYGHGAWMPTRAKELRYVLDHPDLFINEGWVAHNALTGGTWRLIPNELDGAEHRAMRSLMNPWFSPKAIGVLKDRIRERAAGLIDRMLERDSCEFMTAFGRPFPITIFLELMGFPVERLETFVKWEFDLLHTTNHEDRARASSQILDFLWDEFCDRRANPRDDLTTRIALAEIDGRPLDKDQAQGMLYSLFAGGLDTVASSLSFFFQYLARHPELQEKLRADVARVPRAIDEFLRRFSPVNSRRMASEDTELGGVRIRKGEWVFMSYALISLDPEDFPDPLEVDVDRKSIRHGAFAMGPHFCIGAHLARLELTTALEQWLTRVPPFRLVPGAPSVVHGGGVYGFDHVELTWG